LAQRGRKRAAIAHRIADLAQNGAHVLLGGGIHKKSQRAVQVLAGAEHHSELAGDFGYVLAGQPFAGAEFGTE